MMKKTKLVFSFILILTAVISASLGYFAAYTRGLFNMYHADAEFYCYLLTEQSSTLARNVDSSGVNVNGLIDAIEKDGDDWAKMLRSWLPHCRAKDKKTFSRALERWETTKKKVEELRSSIHDN